MFLFLFFSVLFSACLFPFWYFSIVFDWPLFGMLSASFLLFLVASLYPIGDSYGQRTSRFFMKRLGGIGMGTASIGVSIGFFGALSLYFQYSSATVGYILASAWFLVVGLCVIFEYQVPRIKTLNLSIGHDETLHIVQLTDIHLNGLETTQKVEAWVDKVNKLEPDVIVFTGDLLDVRPAILTDKLKALSKLKASYAKLAVSGNHDFYTKAFDFPQILSQIGFEYLDNQYKDIQGIRFVGLPDKAGLRHNIKREKLASILAKASPKKESYPVVLLDHRPDDFKEAAIEGVRLQLSGHTHWGQIPPFGFLVRLRYRYGMGLGRFKNAYIYTSKGTSVWGPPMRLLGRSEIVSISLT